MGMPLRSCGKMMDVMSCLPWRRSYAAAITREETNEQSVMLHRARKHERDASGDTVRPQGLPERGRRARGAGGICLSGVAEGVRAGRALLGAAPSHMVCVMLRDETR
jgi:hypothetical protein